MVAHMTLWLVLLTLLFQYGNSSKHEYFSVSNSDPVPPQPSQYTTSIVLNGRPVMYYADTTVYRDRLDEYEGNQILIIDFKNYRVFEILPESCSWSQIPGKITPLLSFSTYEFDGNITHNGTICYVWNGCHNYEIPPAPFYYYATVNGSIPIDLILPTIDVNIHFSNFTFGPPPAGTFDIPGNCTQRNFDHLFHPIIYNYFFELSDIDMLC